MEDNFRWLRTNSGVHIHADLIVGLPGESIESFATGFNRLLALDPQEIQVGILKRLRGTPIIRHDAAFGMKYSPYPPYEILENSDLDFATLARLRRFAGFWDLYGNSGNFTSSLARLWKPNPTATNPPSPFHGFLRFSDWLHEQGARTSGVALPRQYQLLLQHLLSLHPEDAAAIHETLASDFQRPGRRDLPPFLQGKSVAGSTDRPEPIPRLPRRQARHLPAAAPVPGPIPSSETSPT
jgi:hypothetical protein